MHPDTLHQVEKLREHSLEEIEHAVAQKRVQWFKEHRLALINLVPTPRRAFEMLFFDYMGLHPQDLPILSESELEITWLSRNPCPTLDACEILGLDTRQVCLSAYERSTQALLSCLDPQLRFLRSYREIRPHAPHCRESIIRLDFGRMMETAMDEARLSLEAGCEGCGAVAVLGDRVLARARDRVLNGSLIHAEAQAMHIASQALAHPDLRGMVLFSTRQPCPSCLSLAEKAHLTTIVFGFSPGGIYSPGAPHELQTEEMAFSMLEVVGGVLMDKCLSLQVSMK